MSESSEKKKRQQKQEQYAAMIPKGTEMEDLGKQILNGVEMWCTKASVTAGGMTAGFTSMVPADLEKEPTMVNIRTCVDINAIRIVRSLLTGLTEPQTQVKGSGDALESMKKFLEEREPPKSDGNGDREKKE